MKNIFWTVILAVALVSPTAGAARAAKKKLNACGCYGEGNNCTCTRNAKCGCPGECEPKGCEEARQKQLQKEIEAETKKAKEAEAAAERKLNPEAKAEEGDDAASGKGKAKAPVAKPMTAAAKKQLVKFIEAYLAAYPENKNKMLWEVRDELK
jgi:hypothetical protein